MDEKKSTEKEIRATKANILEFLKPFLKESRIEKSLVFTVKEWKEKKQEILDEIEKSFLDKIVIRSSAINEDRLHSAMAGYFYSALNIDSNDEKQVENEINNVIDSYNEKENLNEKNQILIQQQTKDIILSGVIFTRNLNNYSPYYIINYDDKTGLSDTVTSGIEGKVIKISRFCKDYPEKFKKLMIAIKEIENIIPYVGLDVEFALDKNNEVTIFQVRPIPIKGGINGIISKLKLDRKIKNKIIELKNKFLDLSKKREHLSGEKNYFGDMPDWNPAEIIGDNPNHLDYSLYDYIITDSAWHEARTSQGYYNVNPAKLVILFGNKPYIDIRNTFNSFIPVGISKELREKLLDFYLDKLKMNPHLQDKVEFEILFTCYDIDFDKKSIELKHAGFSDGEIKELKENLIILTNNLIINSEKNIKGDLNEITKLETLRKEIKQNENIKELLENSIKLLDDCRQYGTVQFSKLARLAFIGKILLKSLVDNGILNKEQYHDFLRSINTVASKLNEDFELFYDGKINKEKFLGKYGHLRPGTYDITSLRYDQHESLVDIKKINKKEKINQEFHIDEKKHVVISNILKKHGLDFSSQKLFDFIKESLETRELAKFEFTKNLSEAIELIAKVGQILGFSREEIANLDISDIKESIEKENDEIKNVWKEKINEREKEKEINNHLILPPIIFSEKDLDIISYYQSKPNFITNKKVNAPIINISGNKDIDLQGKIVFLESGDPGYDWIFTKNIWGLVTKYGGVASHMAIRCAEFGIPAAIGCGEIFDNFKNSSLIFLDCQNKIIKDNLE